MGMNPVRNSPDNYIGKFKNINNHFTLNNKHIII